MSEKDEHQEWIEYNDWISMYGSAERALRVALERLKEAGPIGIPSKRPPAPRPRIDPTGGG